MSHRLTISLAPADLDAGSAEERATFGLLAITANGRLLTEGTDTENRQLRDGPYVSGYALAEWFAWNWWRIRWELGRPSAEDAASRWDFAHRMPAAGEGYAWPNVTLSRMGNFPSSIPDLPGTPRAFCSAISARKAGMPFRPRRWKTQSTVSSKAS